MCCTLVSLELVGAVGQNGTCSVMLVSVVVYPPLSLCVCVWCVFCDIRFCGGLSVVSLSLSVSLSVCASIYKWVCMCMCICSVMLVSVVGFLSV